MSEREGVMGREVRVSLEQDCTWLFEKAFAFYFERDGKPLEGFKC